jgi:hypothetical protein
MCNFELNVIINDVFREEINKILSKSCDLSYIDRIILESAFNKNRLNLAALKLLKKLNTSLNLRQCLKPCKISFKDSSKDKVVLIIK